MPTEENVTTDHASGTAGGPLLSWLRIVIKWKKLVWRTALGIVLLGVGAAFLLPNHYTASAVLLPPQMGGASSSAAIMAQLSGAGQLGASAGGMGIKNPNDQQIALLKSRTVEDAMVARFHLRELYRRKYFSTARQSFEKHTETDNGLKDGLIHLSVTDTDPRRAAEMANGWVEEYQRFTATLAVTEASQRRLFYERELDIARQDLAQAEEAMKQTEQRTGVIDIEGQDRAMIATAAELRGQLTAKLVEIRSMHEFAGERNPDLLRAQQEAASMEAQLAAMDAANDRKTGDLVEPKGKVTQDTVDYTRAMREVKYRETVQDLLTRQFEGARVDEARQGAMIQIVDPAVVPDRPTHFKLWILLGALLAALPLALFAAQVAEMAGNVRLTYRNSGSWGATVEELCREHSL